MKTQGGGLIDLERDWDHKKNLFIIEYFFNLYATWGFLDLIQCGTIEMSIGTSNWDVEKYRNKLEKKFQIRYVDWNAWKKTHLHHSNCFGGQGHHYTMGL